MGMKNRLTGSKDHKARKMAVGFFLLFLNQVCAIF